MKRKLGLETSTDICNKMTSSVIARAHTWVNHETYIPVLCVPPTERWICSGAVLAVASKEVEQNTSIHTARLTIVKKS